MARMVLLIKSHSGKLYSIFVKGACIECDKWYVRVYVLGDAIDIVISAIFYTNGQCRLNDVYGNALN